MIQHTKTGKIYPNDPNYTKLKQNIPNSCKMALKFTQHLSFQDTTKFTQIGIFGLKIHHLATLVGDDLFDNGVIQRVARWYIFKPILPNWVHFESLALKI
jgi:hypothetical protein